MAAIAAEPLPPPDERLVAVRKLLRAVAPQASDEAVNRASSRIFTECAVLTTLRTDAARPLPAIRQEGAGHWTLTNASARKAPPLKTEITQLANAATKKSDAVLARKWAAATPLLRSMIAHAAGGVDAVAKAKRHSNVAVLPGIEPAPPRGCLLVALAAVEAGVEASGRSKGGRPPEWQRDAAGAEILATWAGVTGCTLSAKSPALFDFLAELSTIFGEDDLLRIANSDAHRKHVVDLAQANAKSA
ncbi:hypothetical protein [Xanthobacter autotrophicus]|uniref:hypothetical protein n=1 Tax=Xanthobacter autotrophicus TaxID=280 RepID=UPI003729140E